MIDIHNHIAVIIYVYMSECMDIYSILHILFHRNSLQNIECSSLCYIVGLRSIVSILQ